LIEAVTYYTNCSKWPSLSLMQVLTLFKRDPVVIALSFLILIHVEGFPYACLSNNPNTMYRAASAALHFQFSDLRTTSLKTVLHISQCELVHCHTETTNLI